ncbi:hypothetical protein NQZ68_009402 [Dissostichus eleginoides]|nr:hypothetical protein NQZ68_009402 [Dissostichus eleginoides]
MHQYAQGKHRFSTGQRPKSNKWKSVIQRIDACPLTPIFNLPLRYIDIFVRRILCKCGYHVVIRQLHQEVRAWRQHAAQVQGRSSQSLPHRAAQVQVHHALQLSPPHRAVQHLVDFHAEQCCEQCGKKTRGAMELLKHIEDCHLSSTRRNEKQQPPQHTSAPPTQQTSPPPQQQTPIPQQPQPPPSPLFHTSPYLVHLRPPEVNWVSFFPKQFIRVIKPADREWIAMCLYEPTGQLRQQFSQNWFHPPNPPKPTTAPPEPMNYYRQRMFLWAPMRMWGIPLKCPHCGTKMHHSGIYTKVREVIDLDSRYYLVGGDYPRCSKCMIPVCPWSTDLLVQLDPAHRNRFPAVLTAQLALDRKCVTMLKPRTVGNSSSYLQQALEEVHSEEWARHAIEYLADCELHKKRSTITQSDVAVYMRPPPFSPLPLAQWFETVHANEILGHLEEMKGIITSTYGRILKLDSTKKITKKLAGGIADTATWMTNVSNECGEVLNCVLTTGERAGLEGLCQGIVKRYQDAGEPEPEVIYVDRDCCNETGDSQLV